MTCSIINACMHIPHGAHAQDALYMQCASVHEIHWLLPNSYCIGIPIVLVYLINIVHGSSCFAIGSSQWQWGIMGFGGKSMHAGLISGSRSNYWDRELQPP